MWKGLLRTSLACALLGAAYLVLGRLGLKLYAVNEFATLVWPPTGLALASLLIFGLRLWPGVAAGAFLVNLWTGASPVVAMAIACGNTLEAVAAAYLLGRLAMDRSLSRLKDVAALLAIGAVASTIIAASVGALSLLMSGTIARADFWTTWRAWWLGDAFSNLLIAPFLLTWLTKRDWSAAGRRRGEALALAAGLVVVTGLIVTGTSGAPGPLRQPYALFPLLLWAALSFGPRGATAATLFPALLAIWSVVAGQGAFIRDSPLLALLGVQAFVAVAGISSLVLAAAVAERRRAERDEALLSEVSRILASSLDYGTTIPAVFKTVAPEFTDWCAVSLVTPDGREEELLPCRDAPEERCRDLLRSLFEAARGGDGGGPLLIETAGPPLAAGRRRIEARVPLEPEERRLLERMELYSAIGVELRSRGRKLGDILFVATDPSHRYGGRELEFADEISQRVALAIDAAHLFAEARSASEVRDVMMSIASHELRTPLNALGLQLAHLRRTLTERGEEPRTVVMVERSLRQTARLAQLIDNLLDVGKLSSGSMPLRRTPLELGELVRDVAERLSDSADQAGCELLVRCRGDATGLWDRLRLEQVITNLVSNALKYGAGKPVEVEVSAGAHWAWISVRDHGIGIAQADLSRIFERFERAVTERHYGGLGLGLFIARQIVEAHGGRITVESRPGEGSTFTVELPRQQLAAREPPGSLLNA